MHKGHDMHMVKDENMWVYLTGGHAHNFHNRQFIHNVGFISFIAILRAWF